MSVSRKPGTVLGLNPIVKSMNFSSSWLVKNARTLRENIPDGLISNFKMMSCSYEFSYRNVSLFGHHHKPYLKYYLKDCNH